MLGALRPRLARRFELIADDAWAFCLVVDFPAFHWNGDEERWEAEHHMFTAPKPSTRTARDRSRRRRSQAYDLVINGHEAGGGSIRIHRADLQERIFRVVGFPREVAEERFGFLLGALRSARRRTAAWRSASTARRCCSPAPTRSAT